MTPHEKVAAAYPTALIQTIIAKEGKRNLRDYRDHETRWLGDRLKALRAELRARKAK